MAQTLPKSYKHSAPFDTGFLSVGSIHKLHYEQYGNKEGKPGTQLTEHIPLECAGLELITHQASCSTNPMSTIFFNPSIYRVILFDQRGCGQSLPLGEIRDNTVPQLVSDIEVLRQHIGIQRWHVFGASWGSNLAVLYAQAHPSAVVSLVLRGVAHFEWRGGEIDFNEAYRRTRSFRPEVYEELVAQLSEDEQGDIAGSYVKRFSCGDRAVELAAMRALDRWGGLLGRLIPNEDEGDAGMTEAEEERMVASTRIMWHYHAHNLWLRELRYLEPEMLEGIKHIPCGIVNGRYDLMCPPIGAWRLHKALPESKLYIIPDAGHSAYVRSCSLLDLFLIADCRYRSRGFKTNLSIFAMSLQRFLYDRGDSISGFRKTAFSPKNP